MTAAMPSSTGSRTCSSNLGISGRSHCRLSRRWRRGRLTRCGERGSICSRRWSLACSAHRRTCCASSPTCGQWRKWVRSISTKPAAFSPTVCCRSTPTRRRSATGACSSAHRSRRAAAASQWCSCPGSLSGSRARVPSFYALDVMRAATGRIPHHEELERTARDAGDATLAWPAPSHPEDAIDDQEHDLAVLRALLDETDPGAVRGHAHYLLKLNECLRRSVVDRWARGERR